MFYALIETGEYEGTHVEIYKLDKLDKDKFIEFCKISEDLEWEEQLRLMLFCENIELAKSKYLYYYTVKPIDTLLEEISDNYKWTIIDELEEGKDLIISTYEKLLSYNFLEVE